ncbi:RNA polymerase II-associated protein 3-like isoform X3 [Biomphalaria glabrata]|uniref:RNA polymerase II-associated protein 3 n=1 Tax=Biomphalaria glabrata TaxID=6526 RepID=A0A9W3A568_BIOGL|nr:RNA polymerase II-associated protein 3-like isoform X3 [Biomphalaria glabrata]
MNFCMDSRNSFYFSIVTMPISEHEEKMINLRTQVQQNQLELHDYLSDLKSWEKDIKKKENVLKSEGKNTHETVQSELPPIRNTIHKKKLKRIKKEKPADQKKPKKISGFDFRAWDKFDVEKALEEIDQNDSQKDTSSSEYETDEEWEMERKKYLAGVEKDKGNDLLKQGELEKAVEAYTKGMQYDPTNAIIPANRAMALLKQQKFAAAELDCTLSLTLDPLYVKAYLRRATSRSSVGKLTEAIEDFKRVLDLEPTNKQAKTELEHLLKEVDREKKETVLSSLTEGKKGLVKPIYKPPEERSKLPLRTVPINEISLKQNKPLESPSQSQSEMAKSLTAKEGKEFDKFVNTALIKPMTAKSTEEQEDISRTQVSSTTDTHMEEESPFKVSSDAECHQLSTKIVTQNDNKISKSKVELGCGDSLTVPTTSFQFQSDFKLLKNKPESFFQYFQAIPPAKYSQLFGQCLDADILTTILSTLKVYHKSLTLNLYDVMLNLTLVKRFSMTAMFLSQKEKQVILDLIQLLEEEPSVSPDQLKTLRKKYEL